MLPSEYYYMTGLPVKLNHNLGEIHQPRLFDFMEKDITIEEFAQPFCARVDVVDFGEGEKIKELLKTLKDFDLFFVDKGVMVDKLITSLSMLYKTDDIQLDTDGQRIFVSKSILIDRDNFTYLADVVLNMLCMEKPKKQENKRKYADDYRQKLWEKMQKYRAEKEKKNAITFLDIVNFVIHSNSVIDYERVYNLTYYQLVNSYTTLMHKMGYEEHMMYRTSGQFKIESEVKHWGIQSKIKKGIDL